MQQTFKAIAAVLGYMLVASCILCIRNGSGNVKAGCRLF